MSDEIKIENIRKSNKGLIISIVAVLVLALIAVLVLFMPKSANAKKVAEQLSLGDKYLSEISYEQAEAVYLAVIEIDPKNVDAYLGLADVYIAQGEYDKAAEVLEEALEELEGENVEEVKGKLDEVEQVRQAAEVTPTIAPSSTPVPTATSTPTPIPTATNESVPTEIPETPAEYFEWEENEDGTLTLASFLKQGWNDNGDDSFSWEEDSNEVISTIKIPAEVEGKKVTIIGYGAFMYEYYLENVILPEGIKEISGMAFYMCTDVKNINIPSTVTTIGSQAFGRLYDLEEVIIPKNVQEIGVGAFEGCTNLQHITVDERNEKYCSKEGVLFSKNGEVLMCMPAGKEIKKYEIPQGVITIGDSAFYMNHRIQEIIIPNTVVHIGYGAFWCAELEKIFIPASVEQIDSGTFGSFGNTFKEFSVDENNPYYCSEDGVLYSKDKTNLYEMVVRDKTTFIVPEGVIRISNLAFQYNEMLQTVVISDTVEEICGGAFGYCHTLENVVLSKNLKVIGNQAFFCCDKLSSIMLPDGVIEIEFYAYGGCCNLESIEIPASVQTIYEMAFEDCDNLLIKCNSGSYAERYAIENNIPIEIQ